MVYCGKPSKGCDYCRKKRLKCDQKRPGCGQCRNASRQCPGYRNQLDLMFRDESNRVQQKYRLGSEKYKDANSDDERASNRSYHESISSRSSPDCQAEEDLSSSALVSNSRPIPTFKDPTYLEQPRPALSQALSDVATAFYLTQYTTGSHFDYLPLLFSTTSSESLLTSVVQAVSIASLSHETRRPELMAEARQKYSHSLFETNKAIQDARACREDGTLASVLLLAHFETLSSEDSTGTSDITLAHSNPGYSPSASWDRHVQGAVSLVALQPSAKLDNPVRFRLYQHVNAMTRYSCIQSCSRLPVEVSTWELPFGTKRDQADPNRLFMFVIDGFTELRASIKDGTLTDPLEIVQQARSLDQEAALVARRFPSLWSYDVVVTSRDMEGVYRNKYHLYPTHRAAQLWNEIRMTRLAINEIILHWSEKAQELLDGEGDEFFSSLRSRCIRAIETMATEICQSSTEFLQKPTPRAGSPAPFTGSTDPAATSSSSSTLKPSIASAYFLIWPLFTAAAAAMVVGPSLSEFIIDRLHFIGREMNIPQARKAALMLECGVLHEDWLHMLHLF